MILHLIFALGVKLEVLKERLDELRQLEDLEKETRKYIREVVTGSRDCTAKIWAGPTRKALSGRSVRS